jgi:hypothetical protein
LAFTAQNEAAENSIARKLISAGLDTKGVETYRSEKIALHSAIQTILNCNIGCRLDISILRIIAANPEALADLRFTIKPTQGTKGNSFAPRAESSALGRLISYK